MAKKPKAAAIPPVVEPPAPPVQKTETSAAAAINPAGASPKTYSLDTPAGIVQLLEEKDDELTKHHVGLHLQKLVASHALDSYLVLFLYDTVTPINSYHANELYEAAVAGQIKKPILLILHSGGGRIEPAYLISKTCKRLSKDKFIVSVPRRAKSAATLIALGADEIHMGLMSELGPIDPQIGGYPALGLANALNKVAELSSKFPGSSTMWATYLGNNLNLRDLGYFERVSESAAQYAERLLLGKTLPGTQTAPLLANHFVNHYKDHSFVIDSDEATSLLGPAVVKRDTPEYQCANAIYRFLYFLELFLEIFDEKEISLIGSISKGITLRKKSKK
jgi:hypothetical protein